LRDGPAAQGEARLRGERCADVAFDGETIPMSAAARPTRPRMPFAVCRQKPDP